MSVFLVDASKSECASHCVILPFSHSVIQSFSERVTVTEYIEPHLARERGRVSPAELDRQHDRAGAEPNYCALI